MWVLIGLQVCFYSAMKHENDVSNVVEFTVRASYIVFLFVKTENDNFTKLRVFITWWKPRQSLWEFSSRWKPSIASRAFTDLLSNSPKRSPWFSPGYEGTENMFYFLDKMSVFNQDAETHCRWV